MEYDLEHRPAYVTRAELKTKLGHLREELERAGVRGIVFSQEGAMRWLTGVRHQINDIAADAPSPVRAIAVRTGDGFGIDFVTSAIELPRVEDQLPAVFEGLPEARVRLHVQPPPILEGVLSPGDPSYPEVIGRIVRPLLGGPTGNPCTKVSWLAAATTAVLAQTAGELEPGMNGAQVRARSLNNLLCRDIECNVMLVALAGQERHLHPLWDARYRVEKDCWVKLVAGARYADAIVSATVMVKFGAQPTSEAAVRYAALQEGAVEYADCYRCGVSEAGIYQELGRRFEAIERTHGLPGFAAAAYAHHLGGPTSPIGNRDYLVEEGGKRVMFPGMQFAINPLEPRFFTKVELQGIVQHEGPPQMLDASRFTPPDVLGFREIRSTGGTCAKVAGIIQR
jgi:Xaa-Pro aminopeptidase